jgi:putative oxidoreductase
MKTLLKTTDSVSLLVVRLALGIVMFPHGAQKVLGWFGGPGYSKTIEIFTVNYGFNTPLVLLLMAIEFLGSIGLIAGFFTRLSALGIGGAMAICAVMNHIQNGFFMNWFGNQKGEGIEFHILVAGISLALFIKGGGLFSMDRALARKDG